MESKNSEERFIEIMKELCVMSNEKGLTFPNFDFEKCNLLFFSLFKIKKYHMHYLFVIFTILNIYINPIPNINALISYILKNKKKILFKYKQQ